MARYLTPTLLCVSALRIIVISWSKFHTVTLVLTAEWTTLWQTGRGTPLLPTAPVDLRHDFIYRFKKKIFFFNFKLSDLMWELLQPNCCHTCGIFLKLVGPVPAE